ncbi:MAG TPA: enoyl-CoA hydratase-related protein [Burkholderiales bacterium]|nr:enoyl-CoA hydratase-related protein [Burkholderiales bacterium]
MAVKLTRQGAIAHLLIDRPAKANALDSPLLEALAGALEAMEAGVRAVVLAGSGKAFCGGADIHELRALDAASAGAFVGRIHRVCESVRRLPVPVVARLHGAVIGAGLEIAAACDLRIAAEGTRFAMPEVRLGIPSVVEAALLPRLMGSGRAAWLVLTGEAIDARRAYEWGLIEEVCSPESLDERLSHLVNMLIACDAEALAQQKRLLQLWDDAPLEVSIAESIERFAQMPKHRRRLAP